MLRIAFGVFLILHGLVHLLYLGQSMRIFELQPGMIWPDGSWLLSRFIENDLVRSIANVALIFAAAGFLAGGAGIMFRQPWWPMALKYAALFSAVLYIILYDGHWQNLADKGAVGLLINIGILTVVLIFSRSHILYWPY
ncbi:MAG: hypothetical protein R3293_18630 [Candidatus Promineifilaceae bacterium]|nr:hypothetical protein [Candidatus Promineifilaceae bacterium]